MLERRTGLAGRQAMRHLPGEGGIWLFIFGDMMVFSLFFVVFILGLGDDVELYRSSQARLNQNFGAINTVLMLSSSWFVATAVDAARRRMGQVTPTCLLIAFLCGLGFVFIKVFEWKEKFNNDITMLTNEFFMYFFVFSGIHLLHVLIGMGILLFLVYHSRDGMFDTKKVSTVESGASFWHMVDLLWVGLFALLYLTH